MRYHQDYKINKDIKELRNKVDEANEEINNFLNNHFDALKKNTWRFINAGAASKTKKVL